MYMNVFMMSVGWDGCVNCLFYVKGEMDYLFVVVGGYCVVMGFV